MYKIIIQNYNHKSGRTGRCEQSGTAYTFFTSANARQARELIAVLNEAGQSPTKELLDLAKSIPGKGNQRINPRFGRPDQFNKPMNRYNQSNGLINGMKNMGGQGWMNQGGQGGQTNYHSNPNNFNKDTFKSDNPRPFNKYNNNQDDKKSNEGGYKKNPDFNNRFNKPMHNNGFVPNQGSAPQQQQQQQQPGGYQRGYQKNFNNQEGGYKPRNSFVKTDFNGNPRNNFGEKPQFQNNYMGNKPRAPFNNGQPPRFNSNAAAGGNGGEYQGGAQQKFNKFDNYKNSYGEKGEGGSDVFQGIKSFSAANRHYNNSGNRFGEHQNAQIDGQSPAVHAQQQPQQFVQADAIDGAQQFDSNMIPGYRMMATNGTIPPFPPAFGTLLNHV